MKANMNSIVRLLFVVLVFALVPACGGGGSDDGGVPPPVVVLTDDFADLSDWSGGDLSAGTGNPAPSIHISTTAYTITDFDFTSGLTVSWDQFGQNSVGADMWGGIDSGTGGAGKGVGFVSYWTGELLCYMNGVAWYTRSHPGSMFGWANYKISILADGSAKYYVNGVLLAHSGMTTSFTSPRCFWLSTNCNSYVDNVVVTIP